MGRVTSRFPRFFVCVAINNLEPPSQGSLLGYDKRMMPFRVVLVIGNGFDLDLKLKTRYSDFVRSEEWRNLLNKQPSSTYSLIKYLDSKSKIENWFDIEQALLDYVTVESRGGWPHNADIDRNDHRLVCETLSVYLENHLNSRSHIIDDTDAIKLLRTFDDIDGDQKKIYTFNYTSLDLLSRVAVISHLAPVNHIHGSTRNKSIILGFEFEGGMSTFQQYSFLFKSHSPYYHFTNIEQDMVEAEEVIIFGHSLNPIDATYFKHYLSQLSNNNDASKRLTIITYDESSRLAILANLRQMGISIPQLFSRGHLEFILTKEEGQDNVNKVRFEELLNRIR